MKKLSRSELLDKLEHLIDTVPTSEWRAKVETRPDSPGCLGQRLLETTATAAGAYNRINGALTPWEYEWLIHASDARDPFFARYLLSAFREGQQLGVTTGADVARVREAAHAKFCEAAPCKGDQAHAVGTTAQPEQVTVLVSKT